MTKIFFIIIVTSLLTSCHPLFCLWNSDYTELTRKPDKNKICGLYLLSDKSKTYLTQEGYSVDSCKLELNSDGQFVLTNAPGLVFDNNDKKYYNKSGKWFCVTTKDGCFFELEGICVEPFYQKDNNLAISKTIGDGDECRGVIFEKAK